MSSKDGHSGNVYRDQEYGHQSINSHFDERIRLTSGFAIPEEHEYRHDARNRDLRNVRWLFTIVADENSLQ